MLEVGQEVGGGGDVGEEEGGGGVGEGDSVGEGREEPPLSEGGSHWRVAEKGMRSATLGLSGIVGGTVCKRKVSNCNFNT